MRIDAVTDNKLPEKLLIFALEGRLLLNRHADYLLGSRSNGTPILCRPGISRLSGARSLLLNYRSIILAIVTEINYYFSSNELPTVGRRWLKWSASVVLPHAPFGIGFTDRLPELLALLAAVVLPARIERALPIYQIDVLPLNEGSVEEGGGIEPLTLSGHYWLATNVGSRPQHLPFPNWRAAEVLIPIPLRAPSVFEAEPRALRG